MLYITLVCIAYILGILWGLFLTKVGYSPFILLIFAILVYFMKYPQFNKRNAIKYFCLLLIVVAGLINTRIKINDFENKFVNKSQYSFTGYIERKISNGPRYDKYLFKSDDKEKFIIYILNNYEIKEDNRVSFKSSFQKPSHARNHGRL